LAALCGALLFVWEACVHWFSDHLALPELIEAHQANVIDLVMSQDFDAAAGWQGTQAAAAWQQVRHPRGMGLGDFLYPNFTQTRVETYLRWESALAERYRRYKRRQALMELSGEAHYLHVALIYDHLSQISGIWGAASGHPKAVFFKMFLALERSYLNYELRQLR